MAYEPVSEQTREKKLKPINILANTGVIVWNILALSLNHQAYGDSECGNIYEICIFTLVILAFTLLIDTLYQCGYYDPTVTCWMLISYLSYILWASYAYSKLSKDTCFDHYKSDYSILFYFFVITYGCSVALIVISAIIFTWLFLAHIFHY
jgi:hypothetical protein